MSRGVKDLRELICVSRLTIKPSDDELSDTDSRADSQVLTARSLNLQSPDSGIAISSVASTVDSNGIAVPHPPSSERRPTSRRKRKKKKKKVPHDVGLLDLPSVYELPKPEPLPPLTPSEHSANQNSGSDSDSSSSGIVVSSSPAESSSPTRVNFDDMLTFLDSTIIAEWLSKCNETVTDITQWCHTEDNYVRFCHFWLSDFPPLQRQDIFKLEHSILFDQLGIVFATGRDSRQIKHSDISAYLSAVFREYPGKLLSSKGAFMFLDYLDVLTSERRGAYKDLLSDVKCRTEIKQNAQWTLAVRAFALVSLWSAVVNFYRQLQDNVYAGGPVLSMLDIAVKDPTFDRMQQAIRSGFVDVVHYMIVSGKIDVNYKDSHGRTLVFISVMHNQAEVLKYLLNQVRPLPDPNIAAESGNTPLHAAANTGSLSMVRLLAGCKRVEINSVNEQCGNATPLHLAVMHGHDKVAEILLETGADVSLQMDGLSAVDIAEQFDHQDIATQCKKSLTWKGT